MNLTLTWASAMLVAWFSLPSAWAQSPTEWLHGELNESLCGYADALLEDLPHVPLYQKLAGGECAEADLNAASGTLYTDSGCSQNILFDQSDADNWCSDALSGLELGNAANLPSSETWTLNPANRLDIGLNSIKTNHQPFMSRAQYREVAGNGGVCSLEMRIYKKDIAASELKPLLMIHGGSWQYRGAGFVGQEAMLSHYTDAGFVVFAPFYRLAGEAEGGPYCNGVTHEEILSDIDEALNWVQSHAAEYGANSSKITLTGQSAGGYLAASLATRHSEAIDRALLFYPPTDFSDFITSLHNNSELEAEGQSALEAFVGKPLEELSADDSEVMTLSLPQQLQNQVGNIPPMFVVHGAADTLVPKQQSTRLCNALNGSADSGPASEATGDVSTSNYRDVYACDEQGSQLHLIAQGEHVLDVCIDFNNLINQLLGVDDVCFSGDSETGRAETLESLESAISWLNDDSIGPQADPGTDTPPTIEADEVAQTGGSGGGSMNFLLCMSLLLSARWLRR